MTLSCKLFFSLLEKADNNQCHFFDDASFSDFHQMFVKLKSIQVFQKWQCLEN